MSGRFGYLSLGLRLGLIHELNYRSSHVIPRKATRRTVHQYFASHLRFFIGLDSTFFDVDHALLALVNCLATERHNHRFSEVLPEGLKLLLTGFVIRFCLCHVFFLFEVIDFVGELVGRSIEVAGYFC